MIQKRTRKELYDKFRQGAIPSGADFADFIKSQVNLMDDGIDIPEDGKEPVAIRAHGPGESFLDFTNEDNQKRWRISGRPKEGAKEGLNIKAGDSSKLYLERDTGNVGINTDRPTAKLHILQENSNDIVLIEDVESDETPFVITADGNVGIGLGRGADRPKAKLHISYDESGDVFRVDDAKDDTYPFVINDNGNVGIGCGNPKAKLTVAGGGVSIGNIEKVPAANSLYVEGNLEVGGTVVISGGIGGIEINKPLTARTEELIIMDNVRIKAGTSDDPAKVSNGNLSVQGHTTLGTYEADPAKQTILTINGRIVSGGMEGTPQEDLLINETLTVNRTTNMVTVNRDLTVTGNTILGDTVDDTVVLNGTISSSKGDVLINDSLTVTGDATLGTAQTDHIFLNGAVSSAKGDVLINDSLTVTGTATFNGSNIYLNGLVSSSTGNLITINDSLTVKDNLTVEDNLTVTGSTALNGANIYLNGKVSSNNNTDLITIDENLTVTGNATFNGANIYLNGNVSSTSGDVTIGDNLKVTGATTLTGAIGSASGPVSISGSLSVSSDLIVYGKLSFANRDPKVYGIVTAVDNMDDGVITTEGAVKRYVDGQIVSTHTAIGKVDARLRSIYNDVRYVQMQYGWTKNGAWGDGHGSYIDIYPPSYNGYQFSMDELLYYSVSPYYIPYSGDVDGNDTMGCVAFNYGSYIRIYCGNSEQRHYSYAAFYALWIKRP